MSKRLFWVWAALVISWTASAQTFTDDFNDNAKDAVKWGTDDTFGNGRLVEQNQRLDYLVASPNTSSDLSARPWIGQLPNNTNWEAIVQVHNSFAPSSSPFQWGSIGLELTRPGFPDEIAYIELVAESETGSATPRRAFFTSLENADDFFGDQFLDMEGVVDAQLKLSWDAATKILTASFDRDGAGSAYGWQPFGSFGLGGSGGGAANRNWSLSPTQNFQLNLTGYSEHGALTAGQIWADNFTLKIQPAPPATPFNTVTDDFNDNVVDSAKWGNDLLFGNGHLIEQNQRLDYIVPSADPNFDQAMRRSAVVLPINADWEAIIQVHDSFSPTGVQYASVGLELNLASNDSQGVFIEIFSTLKNAELNRGFYTWIQTEAAVFGENFNDFVDVTDGLLKLSYQASNQVVSTFFNRDATSAIYGWQPLGSYGLNNSGGGLASSPWNLNATNRFNLLVYGYSIGGAVTAGQMWADNFSLRINDTPRLTVARAGANLKFTWPAWATDFILQTRTNLTSGAWQNVSTPATLNGENFEATIPAPSQNQFFQITQ